MSKIKFDAIIKESRAIRKKLAKLIGVKAVNHFKGNFRLGGFLDGAVEKWKPRKVEDKGRAILVKSGLLRKSIKVIKAQPSSIVVGTNTTDYASYHNQGSGDLPERKFIGSSSALNKSIRTIVRNEVKKIFK